MDETFVSLRLSVSAATFLWWLRKQLVDADRIREVSDGPMTCVATLYWRDWRLHFFDHADEEQLLLGAKYCVLDLGPESCRLEAAWALGKGHEYFPMYLEVIEDARAEFGTGKGAVRMEQDHGAAAPGTIATPQVAPQAIERDGDKAALSSEGQREAVRQYWADKEKGLFDDSYWDPDGTHRTTQDKWAKERYHISGRTLRRYIREHADLKPKRKVDSELS